MRGIFLFGLVALVVASCNDVNLNGAQTGTGHMNFYLKDAPANYDEVNIDVQGLRIHYTANSDTADTNSGKWIDLPVEPMQINLLDLTNGLDTLLSSAELDAGHYTELRLLLGGNNNVVIGDNTYNLMVPSGQQSGYKIKFNTNLEDNENLNVSIDFNAAKSVVMAGKSGKYILKPVLKAYLKGGAQDSTQTD